MAGSQVVLLCAGRGSRLGSASPKCLTPVGGQPILHHLLRQFDPSPGSGPAPVVVVAAHDVAVTGWLRRTHPGVQIVVQPRADGIVGALAAAAERLVADPVVVLGDLALRGHLADGTPGCSLTVWPDATPLDTAANFGVRLVGRRVAAVREKPDRPEEWTCGVGIYHLTLDVVPVLTAFAAGPAGSPCGITEALSHALSVGVEFGTRTWAGGYVNVNTPQDHRRALSLWDAPRAASLR